MTSKNKAFQVLLAQSGNREAFDQVLQSIQKPIYQYLKRILSSDMDAEETLQDVFLQIFRKIDHLKDPLLFNSWVYRIATRSAITRFKQRSKWNTQEYFDENNYEDGKDFEKILEIKLDLNLLIPNLSPAAKIVFVLHQIQGLKLIEISEILEVPIGTVKSRLAYANKTLQKQIMNR